MSFETKVVNHNISDRFGFGYRWISKQNKYGKQYFAWLGKPDRNSSYIYTCEISSTEYYEIEKHYKNNPDDKNTEFFEKKYIQNHKILMQGWDCKYE